MDTDHPQKPQTEREKQELLSALAESTIGTFLDYLRDEYNITDVNVTVLLTTPKGSVLASNQRHGQAVRTMLDTILNDFFQTMREQGRSPQDFINELREAVNDSRGERGH